MAFWSMLLGLASPFINDVCAETPDADRYQVYELKFKDVAEAESALAQMLEGFTEPIDIVADAKSNRLLVRGPEKAQRIVTKVLKTIDKPASEEKPKLSESVVKSYDCPKSKLEAIVAELRERYSERASIRIAGYSAGEKLLILAPPQIHQEILKLISGDDIEIAETLEQPKPVPSRPARTRESVSAPRKIPVIPAERRSQPTAPFVEDTALEIDQRFLRSEFVRVDVIATSLRKLLNSHLEVIGATKSEYRVTDAKGNRADLTVDRRRNGIKLRGHQELNAQVAQLFQSLDQPTDSSRELICALPLNGIDPDKVLEIALAFQKEARKAPLPRTRSKLDRSQIQRPPVIQGNYIDEPEQFGTIRLAGNQDAPQAGENPIDPMDATDDEARELEQRLRKIGPELEVDILPDLDVIILRGNKPDVQEMTRILKELERLSAETEPVIEIYPLQHVRGESLSVLIEKVNVDLTGGIRGKVTVTPLVKPNSMLIIGWGDAVRSMMKLIEKLDQPVIPDAQFQVFRLKHADASPAKTTVQEFFTRPASTGGTGTTTGSGLAARVQVTADTRTNSLIVQAAPRDLREAADLIEQLDVPSGAVVHQARIFKLKNTLAADLATVLQSAIDAARGKETAASTTHKSTQLEFVSIDKEGQQILKSGMIGDVKITAEPHTNSLLVSAAPESMDLIASLIRRLDESSPEGAQIKVFRVINGDATSLAQMLRSLVPPPNGPSGSPQLANSRDETSLVPARFSVDLRTNSIIATGSAGDLRIIEALLFRLDQKDVEQRKNMVYRLKNAPADAVARSVNDFLRSERTVQQAAPGNISPFQQIESEVVVVPEPVSNSLILSATPRFFEEISKLVEKLDAQPPQVMIQVLIAEVSLNNTNEFGVELGLQDSLLFDRSLMGNLVTTQSTTQQATPAGIITQSATNILGATNAPGFAFNGSPLGNSGSPASLATAQNVAGQAVSNFGVGSVNSQLGYGGLVLSASSENISVLIRALQQSNRLEVLSRPQIRTLDNQPAFIQIGQRVPRIQTASVTQVGSVNGVTLENVGLILGVTPRISPDGMVVMEVDAEKSEIDVVDQGIPVSVSSNGTVIRSPIFNITTASTTVSANSGETIIIGGLITKSTNDTKRRVPLLSEIPLLGNLFRYDSLISQRTELLIILTPYVIRGPEESARIKREETARMHWCAGDVFDIYGNGIICDDPQPNSDSAVPVIYPDLNPRGILSPPDLPPAPAASQEPTTVKTINAAKHKKKRFGLFSSISQKQSN